MDIRVFTFSEWAKENPSNREDSETYGKPASRQTWTIEVSFERPKRCVEQPKTLAEHIRKNRIESGLTQRALGVLLNVAECTVYNWERGIGPRGSLRNRVLAHLGVSPMSKNTEPGS